MAGTGSDAVVEKKDDPSSSSWSLCLKFGLEPNLGSSPVWILLPAHV